MSNTTYYNLDKAIFGYDVDLKVNQRKDGKSWFTFLDGRVGQESEIEKGISDLLTSIVEANKAVNGMGFVNDFDYMLAREMSERPDLLIRDKPKVDKALKNRLRDVMPGVENLGDEVDVGLLLTAYSKIAFDHGRLRESAKTLMDKIRIRMSERVSPDQVMVGVVEALNIYADEISSRSINIDEDRHRKLTNTVEKVIEEVESLGIDVDVQKVTRLQSDLDFMSSLKNLSL